MKKTTTNRNLANLQIAKLLRSVSAALTLTAEGANVRFRIIAYANAADAIEHATSEVKDLWDDNKLVNLAGVGSSIAGHLDELFRTGRVKYWEEILAPIPPAVFELMEIPGIGPKNAFKLCKTLGITKSQTAISLLEKAAKKGRIRDLPGFGEDSEKKILQSITEFSSRSGRILLPQAQAIADSIVEWVKAAPGVKQIHPLGSLRRQVSTVGDIDIAVASDHPKAIIERFKDYPQKSRVIEAGTESASLLLPNGAQVDLMVQPTVAFGALLQHFTGSKFHNVALREYALKKGYSLSEHGIKIKDKIKPIASEEEFYNFLGLDWVPPELREDTGEIQAALNHNLPKLIELSDIRGDLQIHSNLDIETSHDVGTSSVADLVKTAKSLGYDYIGLTEHNPAVSGNTPKQVIEIIKQKTAAIKDHDWEFKVFNGLEIDIQPNGTRALPDEALEMLDYACVSIHSSFRQDRKTATARVLKALDHPKIKFFAHPTGRLLGEREGVDLDWDQIFGFCIEHNKWLEIDAWPNRLDLPDTLVREAVKHGIKLVIDTDSHSAEHLTMMRYGISVARRGWATPSDVVNTLALQDIMKLIQ